MAEQTRLTDAELEALHEKITPGPWQCYADVPSTDPNWHIVTNATRMRVVANVHIEPGNAMDVANARLVTNATNLLAEVIERRAKDAAVADLVAADAEYDEASAAYNACDPVRSWHSPAVKQELSGYRRKARNRLNAAKLRRADALAAFNSGATP